MELGVALGSAPHLAGWENFYVIVGSSAGALTGLMFVVIALTSTERIRSAGAPAVRAFATPTVVHFATTLLLSATLSIPRLTSGSLGTCLLIIGVGSLAYVRWIFVHAKRVESYQPVRSDWIWSIALPAFAHVNLTVAGAMALASVDAALYFVAATALLLLAIGIHNAWDSAVFLISNRPEP